jgi:small GTP-binding protein
LIHSIYVIRGDGKVLYRKNYGAIKIDESLVSVFLSALTSFTGAMPDGAIKSVVSGRLKFVYTVDNKRDLIHVFCADMEDDELGLHQRVKRVRDVFAEELYQKLATWDGQSKDIWNDFEASVEKILSGIIKIALVGFGGVGKTTVLNLMRGTDIPIEYNPTIAVDVKKLDVSATYEVIIWDFAGQERYTPLWTFLLRGTNIVLLVTDSTVENVVSTKRVYLNVIKKRKQELLTYCLCNKQDMPRAMKPKLVERILSVPCYPMVAINPTFREELMNLITSAIDEWARSAGQKQQKGLEEEPEGTEEME